MSSIRILSIETSTSICSVALHSNGVCVDFIEINEQNAHSSKLTVLIEQLLEQNNVRIADCDAIAISGGPGSYTGLRIGTSVAKGLCYAANLPLIAVDTLQALALACKGIIESKQNLGNNTIFMPMIDARRMEVYTSQWNTNMKQICDTLPLIVDTETIHTFDSSYTYVLCGDGSAKCKDVLNAPHIHFVENCNTTAQTVGTLAYEKFQNNQFEDVAYYEPFYLKEFVTTTPKNKM